MWFCSAKLFTRFARAQAMAEASDRKFMTQSTNKVKRLLVVSAHPNVCNEEASQSSLGDAFVHHGETTGSRLHSVDHLVFQPRAWIAAHPFSSF